MQYLVRVTFLFIFFCTSGHAAQQTYVNSKKVNLYQQSNFQSTVITQLKKGDELEVIKHSDKWVRVKYMALQGWVPKYSLSDTKPRAEKVSFFTRLKRFLRSENNHRARVSTVSTAGGLRGLTEENTENSGNKDYEALRKMEQLSVTEQEVEQFSQGIQH